jgi:hypothetical protein
VEQNRASHVLPHHRELARPTARQSSGGGDLIGNTTTETGLRIQAAIDENAYTSGIKVSDEELASLAIERDAFMANGTTG